MMEPRYLPRSHGPPAQGVRLCFTGSTALEITDFAEPNEKTDAIDLWDLQVEVLKRTLGI